MFNRTISTTLNTNKQTNESKTKNGNHRRAQNDSTYAEPTPRIAAAAAASKPKSRPGIAARSKPSTSKSIVEKQKKAWLKESEERFKRQKQVVESFNIARG
jgi:hypothetical protein